MGGGGVCFSDGGGASFLSGGALHGGASVLMGGVFEKIVGLRGCHPWSPPHFGKPCLHSVNFMVFLYLALNLEIFFKNVTFWKNSFCHSVSFLVPSTS